MKHIYTLFSFLIICTSTLSQGYEFGVIHNNGYNFSVIATPDYTSSGDIDISDVGFTLMLPSGNTDITNQTQFNGRSWDVNSNADAATLQGLGVGNGDKDLFIFNMPPGQTMFSHTQNIPFILVSFDVTNMPISGNLEFLLNNSPIAMALSGAADSFYNSDIDGPGTGNGTTDYFLGVTTGMETFSFATLSVVVIDEESLSFNIYPNPTSDYIMIQSDFTIEHIQLYNLLGQKVLTSDKISNNRIDMKTLSSGIYVVKIKANNQVYKKQIIKQ